MDKDHGEGQRFPPRARARRFSSHAYCLAAPHPIASRRPVPTPTAPPSSPAMSLRLLAAVVTSLALPVLATAASARGVAAYQKLTLDEQFFSEGATFGDLNKDGHPDAISGPYWWAGPDFKQRHQYAAAVPWDPLRYSDNFFAFTHDFNGDGWNDILIIGFPGVDASWYQNPGDKGGLWRRHVVFLPVDNESPTFGRLLGADKPPVLICMSRGRIGYATWDPKNPATPWVFHPISPQGPWGRFTHGLGWGDVNGDGRADILEKDGWWSSPLPSRAIPNGSSTSSRSPAPVPPPAAARRCTSTT